jgi:membrane associated rhomboid family serine protease
MIPIRDNVRAERLCAINYSILAICVLGFAAQCLTKDQGRNLHYRFGVVPLRVVEGNVPLKVRLVSADGTKLPPGVAMVRLIPAAAVPVEATFVTSLFLQPNWLLFLTNLWFLAVFGDNVEDRFGHLGYALFVLFCGVLTVMLYLFTGGSPATVLIGASGAVAGVLGAYLVLLPHAKIESWVPFSGRSDWLLIPAVWFLPVWAFLQFVGMSLVPVDVSGAPWWTQLGGFAAGISMAWSLNIFGWLKPPSEQRVVQLAYF